MWRGRVTWFYLGLVALGILWPVLAGAVSCGDCCEGCSTPANGFSLCCFHSASTLPLLSPAGFTTAGSSHPVPADETGGPPPDPRGILHVPRALLT